MMYCYLSLSDLVVLLSTLFAVLWSSQMFKYLNNAPNREIRVRTLENYAKETENASIIAPIKPRTPAPTQKPSSKRRTKRARVATKKFYKTPNAPILQMDEIVPVCQVNHAIKSSASSDDETATSSPIEQVDSDYFSNPTTSSSSQSNSSDDESSGISYPIVINGTTYYSNPIIDSLSTCSRVFLDLMCESQIHGYISKNFKASMKDLKQNGYPFFKTAMSKTATINSTQYTVDKKMFVEKEDKLRTCCGCQKKFGMETIGEKVLGNCQYHPKGKRFNNARGCVIRNCCNQRDGETAGCKTRSIHVFDQLYSSELDNFIQTEKPFGKNDPRSTKILALDAEMVYTMAGPALARLSVIDWFGNSVLDVKVKPPTKVIDANTEYSGLTMKEINAAKDTHGTCRRKLLQLINSETILVGHSLESDLKALRLVHYNVVDTSLLYKSGKNKVGLKALALDYLGLQIQSNNTEQFGHDSEEDARVCLDLLKLRIENSSY